LIATTVGGYRMKTIALIAHDARKMDLAQWANFNKETLSKYKLVGTSTTAKEIQKMTGLDVEGLGSGPAGGDIRIAAKVLDDEIDMIIFLIDVMSSHAHQVDIDALIRTCVLHHTPLALNRKSADLMLIGMEND
jgi:methylglyoxal synthase